MGPSLRHVPLLFHVLSLSYWGRPSGCIIPKLLGPVPAACILLEFILGLCFRSTMLVIWCLFLGVGILHVKGGCLSIATQGSYWLSSPHPLALTAASRPGIPATAEIRSRAGTRRCRAERGAKARGRRHTRTSPSNPAPADARTRPHTREQPLILEISYRSEAPATVAPSPHLMLSGVSDAALLSR